MYILRKGKRFLVYNIGSFCAFLLQMLTTVIVTEVFHIWNMISYAIGLLVAIPFLYFYHTKVTFKSEKRGMKHFTKFAGVYLCILIGSWIGVLLFTKFLHIYYVLAIIVVSTTLSLLSFACNRKIMTRTS